MSKDQTPPEPVDAAPSESPEPIEAPPAEPAMPVAFETEQIAAGSGQVPESFQIETVEKSEESGDES